MDERRCRVRVGLAGVLIFAWASASAQEPHASAPALQNLTPPEIKIVEPLPPTSGRAAAFVEGLSAHGGAFPVILGQSRVLTVEKDLRAGEIPGPEIAVGDPDFLQYEVVGSRHIRLTGLKLGVTDLSIVTSDGEVFSFEILIAADLPLLEARLRQAFPGALLHLGQMRDHIIVEGQARDTRQVTQILQTINAYLLSLEEAKPSPVPLGPTSTPPAPSPEAATPALPAYARLAVQADLVPPQVINLIRVPGPQQVLLKVQIAELNRTALRELGVSFLVQTDGGGFGQNISGGLPFAGGTGRATTGSPLTGGGGGGGEGMIDPLSTTNLLTAGTPIFGVISGGDFSFYINALRRNNVFRVLAEPNLVALQGQQASFLAGGEFPIPVPQAAGLAAPVITVEYRQFGVGLTFVPFIIDGDVVRLSVAPEVSSLDFSQGLTLQGFEVPAIDLRRTQTVVELRHGETLAISGLLQLELNGSTERIPGLGDLPYIGAFFRNDSVRRTEKELVVLVTPYLVRPMNSGQVPPLPGDDVTEPDDFEFFLLGHIESLYGCGEYRSTAAWADPLGVEQKLKVHKHYVRGPHGYSD